MGLTKVFSGIKNDIQLISMSDRENYPREVLMHLSDLGWKKEKVKKVVCHAHFYTAVVFNYEDSIYTNKNHRQGDDQWYRDLSAITIPTHKPGILTKIFG